MGFTRRFASRLDSDNPLPNPEDGEGVEEVPTLSARIEEKQKRIDSRPYSSSKVYPQQTDDAEIVRLEQERQHNLHAKLCIFLCTVLPFVTLVATIHRLWFMGVIDFQDVAVDCPDEWILWSGSCYFYMPHPQPWSHAISTCSRLESSHLLDISSEEENAFIQEMTNNRVWTGGKQSRQGWHWEPGGWPLDSGKIENAARRSQHVNSWNIQVGDTAAGLTPDPVTGVSPEPATPQLSDNQRDIYKLGATSALESVGSSSMSSESNRSLSTSTSHSTSKSSTSSTIPSASTSSSSRSSTSSTASSTVFSSSTSSLLIRTLSSSTIRPPSQTVKIKFKNISESSSNVYTVHGLNKHNPRNDNQWNTSSSSKNALYNKTGFSKETTVSISGSTDSAVSTVPEVHSVPVPSQEPRISRGRQWSKHVAISECLSFHKGKWFKENCAEKRGFICEINISPRVKREKITCRKRRNASLYSRNLYYICQD